MTKTPRSSIKSSELKKTSLYKSNIGKQLVLAQYSKILNDWPIKNEQYSITTRYGATFIIESGEKQLPPLFLLHGSTSNSFCWFGDVQVLSKTHRVFCVDLIGEAGFSDPNRPSYLSGAYARWIMDLLDVLKLNSVSFLGLSLGGWMALEFATTFPERVDKLSLLCPGGICPENKSILLKLVFYSMLGNWGLRKVIKLINGGVALGRLQEDTGYFYALDYTLLIGKHFKPRMEKLKIFSDRELQKLTMPIQLIYGDNDYLLKGRESISRLSRLSENVNASLLANTGHVIANQGLTVENFLIH